MQSSNYTIGLTTCDGQWRWLLFGREGGLLGSGSAGSEEEAMSGGWAAARQAAPASADAYPEIVHLTSQLDRSPAGRPFQGLGAKIGGHAHP